MSYARTVTSYTCLRQKLLETYKNNAEILAIVTHFLQSIGTENESYFKDARKYLNCFPPQWDLNAIQWDVPFGPTTNQAFNFIDLFAGIGGFRIAFQHLGGKCVFSSEWDTKAQITYDANFGEIPFGDITKTQASEIPNHDILLAGFPCQAFSIAGHQGGFNDTRGTLFFDVARIIKEKDLRHSFWRTSKVWCIIAVVGHSTESLKF